MIKTNFVSILSGLMTLGALTASAQDVQVTLSPTPGEYDTLPGEFTLTFDGPSSVTKNITGGNTLLIISPSGARQQVPGTFKGTTVTCTIPSYSTFVLDESGDYTVQLRAGSVYYNWSDGTKTTSTATDFVYHVKGAEQEEPDQPDQPKEVVYDIELQKTIPNLLPLDLKEHDLEILQLYFNMGGLQLDPAAAATATITGPEYAKTATMSFNMAMATSTVFKASFTNPTYSGTYTLTIPQGVLGDEEWIKDHKYGHANAEVVYEFQVTGGMSQEEGAVSISPAPGEYDTLPAEFTLTVKGPESLERNITGGNPLLIISPKGNRQQVSGVFSGNTITCKVPDTFALDESGDYTVQFREGSVYYVWADGSKGLSKGEEYVYNVIGTEEENPDEPKEVAYDVEMIKTIPNLRPLDLDMYGLETLQIYFNMGGLQIDPAADAVVTISGPNYYGTAALSLNMNMPTATVFKALFNDPKYSGDYTLTIPQGVLGDETWIKDHSLGHANAEVVYDFTVINGEDPSTITRDLTFNPRVTPSTGSKTSDLSKVTLSFPSTPYWDAEADIEVYYLADLSSEGAGSLFGHATISRGTGNDLILSITPNPTSVGRYSLTLPEGVCWNAEHEADTESGALNSETPLQWYLTALSTSLEVTGHVPATDEHVGVFQTGKECIVIMTNVKDEVASAAIQLIEYRLNDDSVAPKTLLDTVSTDINADGYVCWINTGEDIYLSADCYYEVAYVLKNAEGRTLTDGSFEFYGDMSTGISDINADSDHRIFNLQGVEVRTDRLMPGLYIKDGKKIIVR